MNIGHLNILVIFSIALLAGCKTETLGTMKVRGTENTVEATEVSASEKLRSLRVNVGISGESEAAKIAATHVENALDDEFAANGFSVVGNVKAADIPVWGKVVITDKTQRGDRIVLRGSATVTMYKRPEASLIAKTAEKGGLISTKTFETKSPEAFSAEEALQKLGIAFDKDVRKWVKETSAKIVKDICVCEITITGLQRQQTVKDGYPTWFVAKVTRLDGVCDCRVISDEHEPTKMSAVVVYEKSQFPDGVLSRLRALKILKGEDDK